MVCFLPFPHQGHDNPLQNACLENPMHRGAWRATVPGGGKELDTTDRITLPLLSFSLLHERVNMSFITGSFRS